MRRGRDAHFQREDSNRLFQTFSSRNTEELTRRGGRFRRLSLNRYQISHDLQSIQAIHFHDYKLDTRAAFLFLYTLCAIGRALTSYQ
jgi:hypothetical protein